MQKNEYTDHWWTEYTKYTPGHICAECKHACLYYVPYWYPYLDPACEISGKHIDPYNPACEKFKLMRELHHKQKHLYIK